METIKIKYEKPREFEEIEIQLPYYSKDVCHYFKAFSLAKCISITDMEDSYEIGIYHSGLAFGSASKVTKSDKDEFEDAFKRVSQIIGEHAIPELFCVEGPY